MCNVRRKQDCDGRPTTSFKRRTAVKIPAGDKLLKFSNSPSSFRWPIAKSDVSDDRRLLRLPVDWGGLGKCEIRSPGDAMPSQSLAGEERDFRKFCWLQLLPTWLEKARRRAAATTATAADDRAVLKVLPAVPIIGGYAPIVGIDRPGLCKPLLWERTLRGY